MFKYFKMIFLLILISAIFSCGSTKGGRMSPAKSYSESDVMALDDSKVNEESILRAEAPKSIVEKERMVIYNSYLSIDVKSIKNSISELRQIAKDYKCYFDKIETYSSYQKAKILLRVPVSDFDAVVSKIEDLGTVSSKSVSAEDITDKYTDMQLRLESLNKIRDRLYSLLKRANKPKERVKILKEINRITGEIDAINENLKYYKNKADYSTIEINLTAFKSESTAKYIPSPFEWIRSLSVHNKSTKLKGLFFDKIKFVKPDGYFNKLKLYKEDRENFIFVTPGYTSGFRAGYAENYPSADLKFWKEALLLDSKNRLYTVEKETQINSKNMYEMISFITVSGIYYSIAFAVVDDNIVIAEAYFKDKKEYDERISLFMKFIKDMEYK